jgi:enoyl-CoA hydratase/carnithine racemase
MNEPRPSGESRVDITEEHGGRVARLILTGHQGNALDLTMIESLGRAIEVIGRWPDLSALVIQGSGRDFSSGHPALQQRPPMVAGLLAGFHECARALLRLNVPMVALIRGRCEGAGAALALLAEVRIADISARIGPRGEADSVPPLLTLVAAERLDSGVATSWLLSSEAISGEQAVGMGVISDYSGGGWESAAALTERHVREMGLGASPATREDVLRTLRAPLLARLAEWLPDLEKRAVERATHAASGQQKWRV